MRTDPTNDGARGGAYAEYELEMHSLGWHRWGVVDQAYRFYWWDNEDDTPIPVMVMHDPMRDEYFASPGQHGWNRAQPVEEMGGWWKLIEEPETVPHPFGGE